MWIITTAHGTIVEHQRHEMLARVRRLTSAGVAHTVARVW